MKFVHNWKESWKWLSVQAASIVVLIPLIWDQLPEETKAVIPADWHPWIISIVGVSVVIGRLIDQGGE